MFKSVLKPIQVYFMVSSLQKMEKSNIFTKRTRHSSIFARIFIKLNFAVTIHIFKFTYKKSAFFNIFKLCLNTVQIFRRVIRFVPPPLPFTLRGKNFTFLNRHIRCLTFGKLPLGKLSLGKSWENACGKVPYNL